MWYVVESHCDVAVRFRKSLSIGSKKNWSRPFLLDMFFVLNAQARGNQNIANKCVCGGMFFDFNVRFQSAFS